MKIILYCITVLYALLSVIAALSQLKKAERKDALLMMSGGGLLLLLATILHIADLSYSWVITAAGGLLICIAAFLNGRRGEQFHALHHCIRLVVTILLVIGFLLL